MDWVAYIAVIGLYVAYVLYCNKYQKWGNIKYPTADLEKYKLQQAMKKRVDADRKLTEVAAVAMFLFGTLLAVVIILSLCGGA